MRIVFHAATAPDDIVEYAPLGFGYLAAFLRKYGLDAKCSVESDLPTILSINPDVIGMSCTSQNYGIAIERAHFFREHGIKHIILGGTHISNLPESFDPVFSCAILGEGEDTFHHLMRLLETHGELKTDAMREVPGLLFFADGQPVRTADRELVDPLDEIPAPDRTILPPAQITHILTGRGCPYECRFCSSRRMWGGYRGFSAERVSAELVDLIEQGHEKIHIYDDLFISDAERMIAIADILEEKELLGAADLSCTVRADLINEGLAEIMVRLNITSVTFGLESADENTQWAYHKYYDAGVVRRALAVLEAFEIEATLSGIIGEPDESVESMRKTYLFLVEQTLKGRIAGAEVNVLTPFPGTDYWDLAVERGLVGPLEKFDWTRLARPWHGLLLNPHLLKEAGRLVTWDAQMRTLLRALRRPTIILAPDEADLDMELDPSVIRAIFLVAEEGGVQEVIDQDEIDLLRFGADQIKRQLQALVKKYGDAPLMLITPQPGAATLAVIRAAKLALTMGRQRWMRTRVGVFPVLTIAAELVEWSPEQLLALVLGDESLLPADLPIAEPQKMRHLPAEDLSATVSFEGGATELLDRYAASLPKGPLA